jgi:hypothetical protein
LRLITLPHSFTKVESKMKFAIASVLVAAASFAAASPIDLNNEAADIQIESRGFGTANDFVQNGCKSVIMVYARASTEIGNIVSGSPYKCTSK